jgi:hypothetical protein
MERLSKITKDLNQVSRYPGRDSKQVLPEIVPLKLLGELNHIISVNRDMEVLHGCFLGCCKNRYV